MQHQLALEDMDREHQILIEEKDNELRLLVASQDREIENLVRQRYVPLSGRRYDEVFSIIKKNSDYE